MALKEAYTTRELAEALCYSTTRSVFLRAERDSRQEFSRRTLGVPVVAVARSGLLLPCRKKRGWPYARQRKSTPPLYAPNAALSFL